MTVELVINGLNVSVKKKEEKNGVPGFIAVPKDRVMLVKTTKVII